MSLAMATKGIINVVVSAGGGYPVYVPMDEPDVQTVERGSRSIRKTVIEPCLSLKSLTPRIRAEEEE